MAGPPPYTPPANKKNSNTVLIVVLICVVVIPCLGILALIGFGYFFVTNTAFPLAGCMITAKAGQQALNAYALEKGTYPKAESWQTDIKDHYERALATYKKEGMPFELATATEAWKCDRGSKPTGFTYNTDVAGKKPSEIQDKYKTVLLFESKSVGINQSAKYSPLPMESSPTIIGAPRGWMFIHIEGEPEGVDQRNR